MERVTCIAIVEMGGRYNFVELPLGLDPLPLTRMTLVGLFIDFHEVSKEQQKRERETTRNWLINEDFISG